MEGKEAFAARPAGSAAPPAPPPDAAMFDPNMYPFNFVFSALIPAIITAALAVVVHHKIKKINMLDALSSIY